jgi:hypothetical protein
MNVDYNDLTLGEIEILEDLTGKTLDEIADVNVPKGKLLRALVYVFTKRTKPDFTYEETAKLTLDESVAMLGVSDGEEDPKGD